MLTLMFALGIFATIYILTSTPPTNQTTHTTSINTSPKKPNATREPSPSPSKNHSLATATTTEEGQVVLIEVVNSNFPNRSSEQDQNTATQTKKIAPVEKSAPEPSKPKTKEPEPMSKPKPRSVTASAINTTTPPKPTPVSKQPFSPLSWGVYAGATPSAIEDFESRISTSPDYLAYFVHWANNEGALPTWLSQYAYQKDRTLVLFWEASDYLIGGTDQPEYSYRAILRGDFDDYIEDFSGQLKAYKGPVILIPFSELNGNWTPWSGTMNGNTPEQAVAAFQYVSSYFDDVPNVKIGWAVNSHSVPDIPENSIESYYPGDAYVDIVGVDGFNMNWPWMSFTELFDRPLKTISQYGKPVFIFSFGSAEGPQKAEWLRDALYTQLPRYPLVEGWVYFNQNKERNWLLWSDEDTFEVFTDYIGG